MKLRNTTDVPDEQVREIVRIVRPSGIANFDVMVKNGRYYRGRAYWGGSGYHFTGSPFVVICIAAAQDHLSRRGWCGEQYMVRVPKFPHLKRASGAYLPCIIHSREEYLAYLMAHELRHLWQSSHTRGKVWGARGKFSERDADAYAIRMMRKYRRMRTDDNGHQLGQMLDTVLP
jgi:hypothetical protein